MFCQGTGGSTSSAGSGLSVSGRVDARELKVHCCSVVCPRAVGGRSNLRVTAVLKFARAECGHPWWKATDF